MPEIRRLPSPQDPPAVRLCLASAASRALGKLLLGLAGGESRHLYFYANRCDVLAGRPLWSLADVALLVEGRLLPSRAQLGTWLHVTGADESFCQLAGRLDASARHVLLADAALSAGVAFARVAQGAPFPRS